MSKIYRHKTEYGSEQLWSEGWNGELKSVEYISEVRTPEDKYRVGASAHITEKQGESIRFNFEITESLENDQITYRLYGKYRALVTHILEPVEEGTKFTYVVEYENALGDSWQDPRTIVLSQSNGKGVRERFTELQKHSGKIGR